MLVVIMNDQLLSPTAICPSCPMANQQGQPRFNQGRLTCGRRMPEIGKELPSQYECQMGFRIANITN